MKKRYIKFFCFSILSIVLSVGCTDSRKQADINQNTEIQTTTTTEQQLLQLDSIINNETNKLPQRIDDWNLTNLRIEGNTLIYTYKAVDHLADDYCVTPEEIKQKSIRRMATDTKRALLKGIGLDVCCIYLDKEGEPLYNIPLNKDQY